MSHELSGLPKREYEIWSVGYYGLLNLVHGYVEDNFVTSVRMIYTILIHSLYVAGN